MKKNVLAAFLLLLGVACFAQPRLPKDYYWTKLDNGLEVVVIENHKVPLATIEIAVKNGSYTEGPEYSGLSHLFEHMFFKANKDYPDQEKFLKRTQELGAFWNGTTDNERVNYFFTFDKDSLNAGLKFMDAAIRFPIYRKEDMAKERPVVDGEFQRAESDPGFQLWLELNKKMWGDLITRKNPIGDHNVINTATPEKMMVIKDKYYVPNNSLLVICGDVNHDQALQQAIAIFGSWPNSGFDPQTKYPIPDFPPLAKTDYFIKESSIAQTPFIEMDWYGPDIRSDSAATVAADIFSGILRLNASKWHKALINSGLATTADLAYQTYKYIGPIDLNVVPDPKKLKECYTELIKQLSMLADDDYFTDEQLADAKQIMKRNKIRQEEKPSNLPHLLTYQWCSTSYEYYTDYFANCEKITRSDIQRYIKKFIIGQPYIAGIIINSEMNKAAKTVDFFKAAN